MVFKGRSGYKELRSQLLKLLISSKDSKLSEPAQQIWNDLGYAD